MKLYRICTKNINYIDIVARLQLLGLDATIIQGNGLWRGKAEKSLVIEVVSDALHIESSIGRLAYWLKGHNEQEAVMLQVIEIESSLL